LKDAAHLSLSTNNVSFLLGKLVFSVFHLAVHEIQPIVIIMMNINLFIFVLFLL